MTITNLRIPVSGILTYGRALTGHRAVRQGDSRHPHPAANAAGRACIGRGTRHSNRALTLAIALMAFGIACGSSSITPAATSASSPPTPSPLQTPEQQQQEREVYVAAADAAVDLIRRSALTLSQIGLSISGAEEISAETRNAVSAAADTLRLAMDAMREIPAPEGLEPLKESIIASATFYLTSAEVILSHGGDRPFDFFDFQEPFHTGGENFHGASGLLTEARTAR